MNNERLIEIEKKIAFQENTIEELNHAVIEQQKEIEYLKKEVKRLTEAMTSESMVKDIKDEEPPPHY